MKSNGKVEVFGLTIFTLTVMKRILLYVGIAFCLFGVFPLLQYIFDYTELSDYGKGYIWGKVFILLIGISLLVISRKLNRNSPDKGS